MEIGVFDPSVEISDIQELKGEQNYFEEIKRLEGKGKIIKIGKLFDSKEEALEYISKTPGRDGDKLKGFIPKTEWVLDRAGGKIRAIAVTDEIAGQRFDQINLKNLDSEILEKFDNFISNSLLIFEEKGICPGINLKNFIVTENKELFYVDSEPYPPYSVQSFEMAHARKRRLEKLFGDRGEELLPKTWQWIRAHEVANYKKAKREKKKVVK